MRWIYWLLHWLRTPQPDVSRTWLRDNERRESGKGIEQSRSTWPWKGWESDEERD